MTANVVDPDTEDVPLTPSTVLKGIADDTGDPFEVLRSVMLPPPSPCLSIPSIATDSGRGSWGCSVYQRRATMVFELDSDGADETDDDDEEGLPYREMLERPPPNPALRSAPCSVVMPSTPTSAAFSVAASDATRFYHTASANSIGGLSAFSFHFHNDPVCAHDYQQTEMDEQMAWGPECALDRADICFSLDLSEAWHSSTPRSGKLTPLDVLPVLAEGIDEHDLEMQLDNIYDLDLPDPRQFQPTPVTPTTPDGFMAAPRPTVPTAASPDSFRRRSAPTEWKHSPYRPYPQPGRRHSTGEGKRWSWPLYRGEQQQGPPPPCPHPERSASCGAVEIKPLKRGQPQQYDQQERLSEQSESRLSLWSLWSATKRTLSPTLRDAVLPEIVSTRSASVGPKYHGPGRRKEANVVHRVRQSHSPTVRSLLLSTNSGHGTSDATRAATAPTRSSTTPPYLSSPRSSTSGYSLARQWESSNHRHLAAGHQRESYATNPAARHPLTPTPTVLPPLSKSPTRPTSPCAGDEMEHLHESERLQRAQKHRHSGLTGAENIVEILHRPRETATAASHRWSVCGGLTVGSCSGPPAGYQSRQSLPDLPISFGHHARHDDDDVSPAATAFPSWLRAPPSHTLHDTSWPERTEVTTGTTTTTTAAGGVQTQAFTADDTANRHVVHSASPPAACASAALRSLPHSPLAASSPTPHPSPLLFTPSDGHAVAAPHDVRRTPTPPSLTMIPPSYEHHDSGMYYDRKAQKSLPTRSPKAAEMLVGHHSPPHSFRRRKRHNPKESFLDGFLDMPADRHPPAPSNAVSASDPVHPAPPSLQPGDQHLLGHPSRPSQPRTPPPSYPFQRSTPLPPRPLSPPSATLRLDHHPDPAPHAASLDESKRGSRWSQFTTSSTSSRDYSSSNTRSNNNNQMWASSDRGPTTFATVFEDEPLGLDLEFSDPWSQRPRGTSSLGLSTSPSAPPPRSPPTGTPLGGSLPSPPLQLGHLSTSARPPPLRKRSKPQKGQHPFALTRAPSPLLSADHLSAPIGSGSLYDQYRMDDSPALQVALLSPQDDQDQQECPVCCESLSSTYRLPGEKPHIVPECGHAIHQECFVTVYGQVPPEGANIHIGVCGVCRQPMRVTHGSGSDRAGRSKLAALVGNDTGNMVAPHTGSSVQDVDVEVDHDDPVEPSSSSAARTPPAEGIKVVVPRISIRSEFPSVRRARSGGTKQHVTAMVTVEVPPATDRSHYPARPRQESVSEPDVPPSPMSVGSHRDSIVMPPPARDGPLLHIQMDLARRLPNYQANGLDAVGPLQMFDILPIRKGHLNKEFHVYLFQTALAFIQEERKTSIRSIFNKSAAENQAQNMTLKLKGRIFLPHVNFVTDTSTQSELSLLITTDNEVDGSKQILITFKDRSSHEMWKNTILRLIENAKDTTRPVHKNLMPPRPAPSVRASSLSPGFNQPGYPDESMSCPHGCMGDLAYAIPIAPHHTPIDLVIAISTQVSSSRDNPPLKIRLLRSSLQFILACMGPKDRIALVSTELGLNGVVRRTPFLNATLHDSRMRLEMFVELLGSGMMEHNHDEFEVRLLPDERPDVVTAINCSLDVILQRKMKNPTTNMVLISDSGDIIKRGAMGMVQARLDAAKIPMHTFGYGKAHDPAALWMVSNHTNATYTFVKEWYHLRDALAGIVGGFMSIALTNMKLRLTTQDEDFRVVKVSGTSSAVVSASGKEIDVYIPVLRHDERREILVEFELDGEQHDLAGALNRHLSINSGASSLRSRPSLNEEMIHEERGDDGYDEVPVVEVDCSFHDPAIGRSATRLANPVLLTLAILSLSSPMTNMVGDPRIVRRRMEVLASDMITRSLVIAARKNFGHATRILRETKRVIETMATAMRGMLPAQGQALSRRDGATLHSLEGLVATMHDVDMFLEGLEVNKEMFTMDHRNFAAQQVIVLRTQGSWTVRTPTELHYATPDVQALIQASADYASRS